MCEHCHKQHCFNESIYLNICVKNIMIVYLSFILSLEIMFLFEWIKQKISWCFHSLILYLMFFVFITGISTGEEHQCHVTWK